MAVHGELGPEASMLAGNQITAEVQTQAQPRVLALEAVFRSAIESSKKLRLLFRRQARAMVTDRNQRHFLLRYRRSAISPQNQRRRQQRRDRKSTRLNSSHVENSY